MTRSYSPSDTWVRTLDAHRGLGWMLLALLFWTWVAANVLLWDGQLPIIDGLGMIVAAFWALFCTVQFTIAARR